MKSGTGDPKHNATLSLPASRREEPLWNAMQGGHCAYFPGTVNSLKLSFGQNARRSVGLSISKQETVKPLHCQEESCRNGAITPGSAQPTEDDSEPGAGEPQLLFDDRLGSRYSFIERHVCRVEKHSIRGWLKRRIGAVAVALI